MHSRPNILPFRHWFLFSILSILPTLGLQAQCEPLVQANFWYGYLDPYRVVFYNRSSGAEAFEWDFGSGELLRKDSSTVIVKFSEEVNTVCLRAWNGEGCSDEQCLEIYRGAPEELCAWTDCVWPGDANGDHKANNYDLLNIGIGYGKSGPRRSDLPAWGDPAAWAPYFSEDWSGAVQEVNFKHADCDGNGWVNETDIKAIEKNYFPDWELISAPAPGAPPIILQFQEETVQVNPYNDSTYVVTAEIFLGTADLPVNGWHGIAFDLSYDPAIVKADSVWVEYDADSFFGPSTEVLTFDKNLGVQSNAAGKGRLDLAFSRKGGDPVDGFGRVATVRFVVISDIIIGLQGTSTPLQLEIKRVQVVDADGRNTPFGLPNALAEITLVKEETSDVDQAELAANFRVFPNPARDVLFAEWEELNATAYELINPMGQVVQGEKLSGNRAQIDISSVSPGLYLLRFHTDEGTLTRKILVRH